MTIRSAHYPRDRHTKTFELPSRAKQSFRDECDINTIMAKYEKTGLIDHNARYRGEYADVTGALELQEALQVVEDANDAFDSLTAKIRKRFDNNPENFLRFVTNPENKEAMHEMGLMAPKEPAPVPVKPDPLPVVPANVNPPPASATTQPAAV